MEHIVKTATINAEPAKVFPLIADPLYLFKLLPDVLEVEDIQRLPTHGWRYRWSRKLLNVHFNGIAFSTPIAPPYQLSVETSGGLVCSIRWSLEGVDGQTNVTVSAEYTIPAPLLHKHSQEAVRSALVHDIEQMLANLAALAESLPAASNA